MAEQIQPAVVEVASCYRCGRDWPGDMQGQCPRTPEPEYPHTEHGIWLEKSTYERGTGRKLTSEWVWVGPCCLMEHSGAETDLVVGPARPEILYDPLGIEIRYLPNYFNLTGYWEWA